LRSDRRRPRRARRHHRRAQKARGPAVANRAERGATFLDAGRSTLQERLMRTLRNPVSSAALLTLGLVAGLASILLAQEPSSASPPPAHPHETAAPATTSAAAETATSTAGHEHGAATQAEATSAGGACACCGGCPGCGGSGGGGACGAGGGSGAAADAPRGMGRGAGGACHGAGTAGAGMGRGAGIGRGPGARAGAGPAAPEPLDDTARAALERAWVDELRAEAMYRQVLEDHGVVRPFAHASYAESRHSEMILAVLRRRGEEPAAAPELEPPPRFASMAAACAAAVRWEEENVALYDELLRLELPADARRVFEHNRIASLEHHLPAFRRCGGSDTGR
jgi:hypothetical protein